MWLESLRVYSQSYYDKSLVMNTALKPGTYLRDSKKYTMTNIRQISKVPAMTSFCLHLKE